jgi:membrane-associated phospholipid phosphatase
MDIEFLLWLQNFREASGNIFTPFMQMLSQLEMWYLLAPIFIYWTVSKRKGFFIILAFCISCFMNGVLKLMFSIYRPFVLDERLIPIDGHPTSYSFPSGHAMSVTPVIGGLAVIARKRALWFSWICVLFALLVGLSRNYVGVHTPQDIAAGMLLAVLSLWIASVIVSHPERETLSYSLLLIICAAGLYYICIRSYPEKYDAGKAIVEAGSSIMFTFYEAGMIAGSIFGRLIERRYINFSPRFSIKGVVAACIGLLIYSVVFAVGARGHLINPLTPFITEYGGNFVSGLVSMLYVTALWPCVIKKCCE